MTDLPSPVAAVEDPVLASLCAAACTATSATSSWIVAIDGDRLRVVAARGPVGGRVRGLVVDVDGSAGFVAASGQPMALSPRPGDQNVVGGVLGALGIVPASLLSLPCVDGEDVVGVLELVDRTDGGRFGFEDVELATLLASVAGPALRDLRHTPSTATPDALHRALLALADDDPARYEQVAWVVTRLLSAG